MARLAGGGRFERTGVMVQEHLSTGGKRMRARLSLAAAAALGASREAAAPWAAAVELLHNATLVHDDIQDGDLIRRGQPTVWVRHGVPQAINAGDLLLMLPFLALADLDAPGSVRWELSRALADHAARTVRGQSEELDLLPGGHLDRAAYSRSVRGKTGALFALPVEGAALVAGLSAAEAAALGEAFVELGVLFQLQDDVLDLYGDKGRGAPGADLKEGKVSALVVAHLERVPEDRAWLLNLLRAPRDLTPQREVEEAIRRFRASGALHDVLDEIHAITERVRLDPHRAELPALHSLALELASAATAPIRHLWGER
jgi:geranylgeranyl pyrophosphate synthase